ncbi:hypothetical protein AB9F38_36245 [Rhizobium leguminosarum]
MRVEQLYPFPANALINDLSRFRNSEMVWCRTAGITDALVLRVDMG